jgi:hypothetical protein
MSEFSVFGQYAQEIEDWMRSNSNSLTYITKDRKMGVAHSVSFAKRLRVQNSAEAMASGRLSAISNATRLARWYIQMLQKAGKYQEIASAIPLGGNFDDIADSYEGAIPAGSDEVAAYCLGRPVIMIPRTDFHRENFSVSGMIINAGSYDMAYTIASFKRVQFSQIEDMKLPEIEDVVIHITKGEGLVVEHTLDGVVPCFVVAYGDELVTYNIYGSSDKYGSVSEFE